MVEGQRRRELVTFVVPLLQPPNEEVKPIPQNSEDERLRKTVERDEGEEKIQLICFVLLRHHN